MATMLRKVYLVVHALSWLDITRDDPRRLTREWEQFPGRCETSFRLEQALKERYERLISEAGADEAVLFLPTDFAGNRALIQFAEEALGERAVVCRLRGDAAAIRAALGDAFMREVERDGAEARRLNRLPRDGRADYVFGAWLRAKAWALDLRMQLEARGYAFDPVETAFVAFGEDWAGCAATYPIHMGRAWGLASPIERRFDLINPDESPMFLAARPVEQNLPMPEHIRLFILKVDDPEGTRYVGHFWEGLRGLTDPAHTVKVRFPAGSVREVNQWGIGLGRAVGVLNEPMPEELVMSVGSGGHTPFWSTLVMTAGGLGLEDFRAALLAGEVAQA